MAEINARVLVTKESKQKIEAAPKGTLAPPIAYTRLIEAYEKNAYHQSCIDVRASNILGNGIADPAITAKLSAMSKKESFFSLLENTIKDFVIFGQAFWELPAKDEIVWMPAWTMYRNEKGWLQKTTAANIQFGEDEVFQFKSRSMRSSFYGSPDYVSILDTIDLVAIITSYNKLFFDNNAIPDSAMIVKGGTLSPTAEYEVQSFFRSKFKGYQNAHKMLYLPVPEGVDIKFEKLQSDLKDAKFQELRDSCIAEIIACHGVPPRLMSIAVAGQLGGGGETEGERKIFYQTRIKPAQNMLAGQLDSYFQKVHNMKTDITFEAFDYSDNAAESALRMLQ